MTAGHSLATMSAYRKLGLLALFLLMTTSYARPSSPNNSTIFGKYLTASGKDQAYVSGGSLISFGNQLLAQEKSDILDSLLYAELTAGEVYNRNTNFVSWYKLYIDILRETGWDIAGLNLAPYNAPSKSYFTLVSMVWDFLTPLCKALQKEVLKRLLDVWQLLKDFDKRVLCFLTNSGQGGMETNAANFQIMPATRGNPGEVILVFGGFHYQSSIAVPRYMKYSWPAGALSLYRSVVVAKFNSNTYAPYRRTLQNALGNKAISLIQEIDL